MYPGDFKPVHHTFVPVSRMMIMTRCLRSERIILRKPWDLLVVLSAIMTFGNTRCFLRLFSKAVDLGTLGTQTHKSIPHTTSYLILWTKMPLCLSFFDSSAGFLQHLSQVKVRGQAKALGVISEMMERMISISNQSQVSSTSPTPGVCESERRDENHFQLESAHYDYYNLRITSVISHSDRVFNLSQSCQKH